MMNDDEMIARTITPKITPHSRKKASEIRSSLYRVKSGSRRCLGSGGLSGHGMICRLAGSDGQRSKCSASDTI
jgi:hypothetical protein